MTEVQLHNGRLRLITPYSDKDKCRKLPERRWLKKARCWSCKPSFSNMSYIDETWPDADWDAAAWAMFKEARKAQKQRDAVAAANADKDNIDIAPMLSEFERGLFGKKKPWDHVFRALTLGRDLPWFAYLMDQGTGKTATVLFDAAHNFRRNKIDALLVLNKNSVKTNWVANESNPDEEFDDAVDEWLPPDIPRYKMCYVSQPTRADRDARDKFFKNISRDSRALAIISINYEALLINEVYALLQEFCKSRKVMIVCDESTMIGKPGSDRTKLATELRALCPIARIASGTPIIKSPLKAYSQFGFLSEDILGFGSFYSFKAHHCIMGGFEGRQVLMYINTDELSEKIASCSYRVKKEDCLDLPEKIHQKRYVRMTKKQDVAYRDMAKKMLVELDEKRASATIQLTKMMRLQQITGGYLPADDGTVIELVAPSRNPLIEETMGLLEERGEQKFVVWAHFHQEIDALYQQISAAGYNVRIFDGRVNEKDRLQIRRDMKAGRLDGVIAQQDAGGMGIDEFKVATLVIYFSNSAHTENRIQSEDRTHRGGSIGHEGKVTYYDLVVPNTVRVKLIRIMRNNKEVSDEIMRDGIREWI